MRATTASTIMLSICFISNAGGGSDVYVRQGLLPSRAAFAAEDGMGVSLVSLPGFVVCDGASANLVKCYPLEYYGGVGVDCF